MRAVAESHVPPLHGLPAAGSPEALSPFGALAPPPAAAAAPAAAAPPARPGALPPIRVLVARGPSDISIRVSDQVTVLAAWRHIESNPICRVEASCFVLRVSVH